MEFRFRRRVEQASTDDSLGLGLSESLSDPLQQDERRKHGQQVSPWASRATATGGAPTHRTMQRPRHSGLFAAIHRLDAELDEASRRELANWIREQYVQDYADIPLGFFATCHLGPPYVDHRLDLVFSIVEHYAPADAVPEPFAQARMLVRTNTYAFVEIYASGAMVPVLADGSAVPS